MNTKFSNNNRVRPLILDGAIGSQIQNSHNYSESVLWSSMANITHPKLVRKIHEDYIIAGADIITTNTFRTNPAAVEESKLEISLEEFVEKSVKLAKDSIVNKENIIIAGSNAPAEDCYQTERTISRNQLEYNHKKHIELLWKYGSDIIINETQSHIDEIEIICEFCSVNKIDFIISFYFNNDLNLLSGESLISTVNDVIPYSPAAIGFNCISSEILLSAVEKLEFNYKWGYYINCGSGNVEDKKISCSLPPIDYLKTVKQLNLYHPYFVGACCGSSPDHIRKIKEYFDEIY